MRPNSHEISDEFLAQLKEDLVCRRVGRGMARLEEHRRLLTSSTRNERTLLCLPATWRSGLMSAFSAPDWSRKLSPVSPSRCVPACLCMITCTCAWPRA